MAYANIHNSSEKHGEQSKRILCKMVKLFIVDNLAHLKKSDNNYYLSP